ncbi:MAG: Uncharacterised protein [Methanobacteriota archaeon]|nr:MAG: Uncharacterised protein [Euryarchaeota archaeon]
MNGSDASTCNLLNCLTTTITLAVFCTGLGLGAPLNVSTVPAIDTTRVVSGIRRSPLTVTSKVIDDVAPTVTEPGPANARPPLVIVILTVSE